MTAANDRRGRNEAPPLPGTGQSKQFESTPPAADTPPYRLLWSLGIVAIVLGLVALSLWVTSGGVILFDMIVALCF
jgi:hypothetical protein